MAVAVQAAKVVKIGVRDRQFGKLLDDGGLERIVWILFRCLLTYIT